MSDGGALSQVLALHGFKQAGLSKSVDVWNEAWNVLFHYVVYCKTMVLVSGPQHNVGP